MHTDRKTEPEEPYPQQELTEKILAAAFKVQNALGCGFLEKVYENALVVELSRNAVRHEQQNSLQVKYEGAVVGEYQADLIVEDRVIVECIAVGQIDPVHEAQLLNYLKATGIHVGLLLNFGRPKLQYRRFVA